MHAADRWQAVGQLEIPVKNRLRVLRAERKWSQAKLADELNVSRQTINAMELGKYAPSTTLSLKLSEIFGVPVNELFVLEEGDWK